MLGDHRRLRFIPLFSQVFEFYDVISFEQQGVGQTSAIASLNERKQAAESPGSAVTSTCKKGKSEFQLAEFENKRMTPESVPGDAHVEFGFLPPTQILFSGREVLALLQPLLARSRTDWNHDDVLALARRMYCCGSVDGTGGAEDLEGETSNILLLCLHIYGLYIDVLTM
jgi:hypothetical protein